MGVLQPVTDRVWELHEIGRQLAKDANDMAGVFDQHVHLPKLRLLLFEAEKIVKELE